MKGTPAFRTIMGALGGRSTDGASGIEVEFPVALGTLQSFHALNQ